MKFMITLLLTMTTMPAFSALTDTLMLKGVVPANLSIAVSADASSSTLDFSVATNDLKVATVVEKSNSKTGYTVDISSANLGKLKRTDGAEVLAYTLKYNNASVNLGSVAGTRFTNNGVTNGPISKDVKISYAASDLSVMTEGTYQDILTFTIAAK